MKTIYKQNVIAAALTGAPAFTSAHAKQYPIPTTATEVTAPALGTAMTPADVQTAGRMA